VAAAGAVASAQTFASASTESLRLRTTADQRPRKVIVGSAMQRFWVDHPGLELRLKELTELVDEMAEQSEKRYGRRLDLAILPETAVSGDPNMGRSCPFWKDRGDNRGSGSDIMACAVPYEGLVKETFARKARQQGCYIVAPLYLLDDIDSKLCSNAAVLVDRKGQTVGIYRKVHVAVSLETGLLEGGTTPGKDVPVFDCDFGKLGIQICFDIQFDRGWQELARRGAELVAWPTQSPQTARPAFYAMQHRYYVVSSTWRHNASVFEPTGRIAAQIKPPEQVLTHELDLSYAILPWSHRLKSGEGLKEVYGDKVGYRYYEEEDRGIFWSNDRNITIGEMAKALGVIELEQGLQDVRKLYAKAGVPGY